MYRFCMPLHDPSAKRVIQNCARRGEVLNSSGYRWANSGRYGFWVIQQSFIRLHIPARISFLETI